VADFPGSDRRSVVRLDRWRTSDSHRRYALPFDLWLTFQLALASFLRQGRGPTFDSHRILILQLGSCPTSGSHRLLLQPRLAPSAAAVSGLRQLPPVCHACGELPTRIGLFCPPASPVLIRSACALRFYFRLGF